MKIKHQKDRMILKDVGKRIPLGIFVILCWLTLGFFVGKDVFCGIFFLTYPGWAVFLLALLLGWCLHRLYEYFQKIKQIINDYKFLKNFMLVLEYDNYDFIQDKHCREIAEKMDKIKVPSDREECIQMLKDAGKKTGDYVPGYDVNNFFEDFSHHEPKVWLWVLAEHNLGEEK